MLTARLEHAGYEVLVARDGEEVLWQVQVCAGPEAPIDLILLDLQMPSLNGLEVCQRLKHAPETAQIPIILFTAAENLLDARVANLCIEMGVSDWLEKPFRSQALLEKVERALCSVPQPAQPAAPRTRAAAEGPVLVVDDDPRVLEFFTSVLGNVGVPVVAVRTGEVAVAAARSMAFSIAFIDVVLPGLDGLQTLLQLLSAQPTLQVIMMTGAAGEGLELLSRQFGAREILYKPFEDEQAIVACVSTRSPAS
jgi:CheY-like chemotaxis protein